MSMKDHAVIASVLYLASALAIGVFAGSLNLPHYSRLEARGASANARVTSTDCGNHGTVAYRFRVDDRTYDGQGTAGFGIPACGQLKPGDPGLVRYLWAAPAQSLPRAIQERLEHDQLTADVAV